eukprot:TRINITY_DN19353_c0_g1_i1.p1 TRINITY_DN19353_c0_g1~~TRINITY_DN19353_c0_g1_i1.p1  ORF type:complete len:1656 (+),score=411.86 TRINITY_DN19353_c0_g1_i1:65-5032(+)
MSGVVYGCGQTDAGQLGAASAESASRGLVQLHDVEGLVVARPQLRGVRCGSGGFAHTLLLAHDGSVYASGANESGQLGMGDTDPRHQFELVRSLEGKRVRDVACGASHSVAVLQSGEVLATGGNDDGQLGLGHRSNRAEFNLVRTLATRTAVAAACGSHHSVVLTSDGSVLVAGRNDSGQLGLGHKLLQAVYVPISSLFGSACDIACGDTHTAVLLHGGTVMTTGGNSSGQLGLGNHVNQLSFQEPRGLTGMRAISVQCGASHTAVLTADVRVHVSGLGSDGQLGLGATDQQLSFTRVKSLDGECIVSIHAGGQRTFAVTLEQRLLVSGRFASSSALSFRPAEVPEPARDGVSAVVCGAGHTVVVRGLADRVGGDPPPPTFVPPATGWEVCDAWKETVRQERRAELSHHAEVTLQLLPRYQRIKLEGLLSCFHRGAAAAKRLAALPLAEAAERSATEAEWLGGWHELRIPAATETMEAERWWAGSVESEPVSRRRVEAEEQHTWHQRYTPFHSTGDTVLAQEQGRIDITLAECLQREWAGRHSLEAERQMLLPLFLRLLDTLDNRLRGILDRATDVRSVHPHAPDPPTIVHYLRRTPELLAGCAALRSDGDLALARKAAAEALVVLRDAAAEARDELGSGQRRSPRQRQGGGAVARRDEALRKCSSACDQWVRELVSTEAAALLKWGEDVTVWYTCLARMLDDDSTELPASPRDMLQAAAPAPALPSRAHLALQGASSTCEQALQEVTCWQTDYLAAVSLAEQNADNMRDHVSRVFDMAVGLWDQQFVNMEAAIAEERRVKELRDGIRPPPLDSIRLAAPQLADALTLVDAQIRSVQAEQRVASVVQGTIESALLAQVQMVELRRKVAKDSLRKAGLQALKAALQFGALTAEQYSQHCVELEKARPQSGPERGLLQLRDHVRERRLEFDRQADMRRRAELGESEDPGEALDLALQAMVDAKRLLHREQSMVAKRQAELWAASDPFLPDVEEELQCLSTGGLLEQACAMSPAAKGLVVDRRKSEYEADRSKVTPLDDLAKVRGRLQWCRFAGRECVLKECRLLVTYGDADSAERQFAKWVSLQSALAQHPSFVPLRAVFSDSEEGRDGPVYYLHYDRYTPLRAWLSARGTQRHGAAGAGTGSTRPPPSDLAVQAEGRRVLRVVRGLLQAVLHLHNPRPGYPDGVVHGNIKATNVLMDGDRAMLVDMDQRPERPEQRLLTSAEAAGIAPELLVPGTRLRSDRPAVKATDVYGLGVIVQMLTRTDALRASVSLSTAIGRLSTKMLDEDCDARPSAAQACTQLEAVLLEAGMTDSSSGYEDLQRACASLATLESDVDALEFTDPSRYVDPSVETPAADPVSAHATALLRARELRREGREEAAGLQYAAATGDLRMPEYWLSNRYAPACSPPWLQPVDSTDTAFEALSIAVSPDDRYSATGGVRKRYRLAHAWRVESPHLWAAYAAARQRLRESVRSDATTATVHTRVASALRRSVGAEVDRTVGETFLLRGCKAEELSSTLMHGPRRWYERKRFGFGIHGLTDDITRCDADTSVDTEQGAVADLHALLYGRRIDIAHPGNVSYALLCRCCCGRAVRTRDGVYDVSDPHSKIVSEAAEVPYDSLVWEPRPASAPAPTEVVVWDSARVLPEFLIAYRRLQQ